VSAAGWPPGLGREPTLLRELGATVPMPAPGAAPPQALPGAAPPLPIGNRLVATALDLLTLLPRLRQSAAHPDPAGLRAELLARLRGFEAAALARGAPPEAVGPARYVISAALDEAVLSTPWGAESPWLQRSLLTELHGEAWGGEKVFAMLEQFRRDPDRHHELIELIELVLALGFQGRYRMLDNGLVQLEQLREGLTRSLHGRRRERPDRLGPDWAPEIRRRRLRGWLPLWVVASFALVLGLLLFAWYAAGLGREVDATAGVIRAIAPPR
jgi:type VI secretion system protein ImpK